MTPREDVLKVAPDSSGWAPMSQNDVIVLKANFENWKPRMAGVKGIDPWLYYCVEQFVKSYGLSDEEIQYGITDGSDDGGADAVYFLVNNGMHVGEDTELAAKSVSKVRLIFIQVKTSGGFKSTEAQKLVFLADDFLDLSKDAGSLADKYNPLVLRAMRSFKEKYLQISGGFPDIAVDFYYATGDDAPPPDAKAQAAAEHVKEKVRGHLNKATPSFSFFGAQQLWEKVQERPARERMLIWSEQPLSAEEGHVGLVKLSEFFRFLKDDMGDLAEKIFESNVRGYQADTPVNARIRKSLDEPKKANFWLLNNGVTIISSKVSSAGHLRLNLTDPQIVNGLQTSREVFSYWNEMEPGNDQRSLLVRVIVTDDPEVSDMVIRATNSQNRMQESSLRMTDPIHRKIEDLLKQHDLYFDRRKGFYKDQDMPVHKIISANALAQSLLSILLQRPDDARARPGDYFKKEDRYSSLFEEERYPLPIYLTSVTVMREVSEYLDFRLELSAIDKRNIEYYVASALTCDLTRQLDPSAVSIIKALTPKAVTSDAIHAAYERVWPIYEKLTKRPMGTLWRVAVSF